MALIAIPQLTVAILAGGAATRLGGVDKGLQMLLDRPLIDWVIDAVAAPALQLLIVANRRVDEYALRARTVSDAEPGHRGPLAGVAAALAACKTNWLLTLPVDCPDPPTELAPRLLAATHAHDVDAAVAHDGERRQPLFALYSRELAASADAAARAGQGVWAWQTSIDACELDFADRRRQFQNLNTPQDFAAYRRGIDAHE